jgi:hypothetical protein
MFNNLINSYFLYIGDTLFTKYKSYSQMSVLFASMYTVHVHQPTLFQTFFVLTGCFRSHNPSIQGVLYLVSHAQTADISIGS